MHVLDNPAWSALTGPQRALGVVAGTVARYEPEVSAFGAFAHEPGPAEWSAMADLIGPGSVVITTGCTGTPPPEWDLEYDGTAVQMTGEALAQNPAPVAPDGVEVVALGPGDVADMVELVDLARPGPFTPRTYELGGYVGIRRDGQLVAMAGQRMRPVGWTEISAVATHPDHRRRGLGELLVRVVAAGALARGEQPVLHASTDNTGAIRLYEAMGFVVRRRTRFVAARAPGGPTAAAPGVTLPGGG